MKYMILIYSDPALEPAYGTDAFGAMMAGYGEANKVMEAAGVMVAGDGLQDIETATSLTTRNGKVETMDGPFAETKERLGGYYIVDCPDLDAALGYAALIPSAAFGTIEVRPLADYGI
jgi:hypothetical protein